MSPAPRQRPGLWPIPVERTDVAERTCSIDGCARIARVRGLCASHFKRWKQHGDPLAGPPIRAYTQRPPRGTPDEERFWLKVDQPDNPLDCWVWLAAIDMQSGYGRFQVGPECRHAHRVSYELSIGEIDPDLELDHLCRTRACVNPLHLEAVTHRENMRRTPRSRVTKCPQGHPYDEANTYINPNGSRACRTCRRIAVAKHNAA